MKKLAKHKKMFAAKLETVSKHLTALPPQKKPRKQRRVFKGRI